MHDKLAELRASIAARGDTTESIAPKLTAAENSRTRLAIGYSDGGIKCDECSHGPSPNPASLRLCWLDADDTDAHYVDLCDCHFGDFMELAIGDAFPLDDE